MNTYEEIIKRMEKNQTKAQAFVNELNALLEQHNMKLEVEGWLIFIIGDDKRSGINHKDITLPDRIHAQSWDY